MRENPLGLGITIPGVSAIASDVEASVRAQLYQQLANFQALPQRLNRVGAQLAAFQTAASGRSLEESARLSGLQNELQSIGGQWSDTNAAVSNAIAALNAGTVSIDVAGQVASALGGIAALTAATTQLEQDTRGLITSSLVLDATTKQQLLAAGAPAAWDVQKIATTALLLFVGYRALKAMFR